MRCEFLSRGISDKLILFFSGFASMPKHFSSLKMPKNHDLLFCYDYQNLDFDYEILANYSEICVIAWSMGVAVASRLDLAGAKFYLGINGTNYGIDKLFGIHPSIFQKTARSFDIKAFYSLMSVGNLAINPNRNYQNELFALLEICNNFKPKIFAWDKAIISKNDKIFPVNPSRKFHANTEILELEAGHFVFDKFKNWDEILQCQIS